MLKVLDTLFTIGAIGVLISIVSFIFMMIFVKRLNAKIVLAMICNFIITMVIMQVFPSIARYEIRNKLNHEIIYFTSDEAFNRNEILLELKDISYMAYKNTHPLKRFAFNIQTIDEEVYLELARDSNDSKTYWVYYPKYYYGRINNVGKVRLADE